MHSIRLALAFFALVVGFGTSAQAQTLGLVHVWTVPGVINASGTATIVSCTNGSTATQTMAVDVYGSAGAFVAGNSITVAANATVIFATSNVTNVSIDLNLGTGTVSKGHARVLASTTKGVVCSALLADAISGAPYASLTVAKKFSQKGD